MALTTYAELKTEIENYLIRTDQTDQLDTFIILAEEEFNKTIRHRRQECQATANLTAGDQTLELPTDFLEMRMVKVNTEPLTVLEFRTVVQLDDEYPYTGTQGIPQSFTLFGNELKVAPAPDSAYVIQMLYFAKIPDLATNSTNWLLTNYPSLYLSGCLIQAGLYLKDQNLVSTWLPVYNNSFDSLKKENDAAFWNAAALQQRPDFKILT